MEITLKQKLLIALLAGAALVIITPAIVLAKDVTESREVGAFTKVVTKGSIDSVVTVGGGQSVSIQADEDDIDDIKTEVKGDTLYISIKKNGRWSNHGDIKATISMASFESFGISGSGEAEITGIDGGNVELSISGSGDITAEGNCGDIEIDISGSGDVEAQNLICRNGDVEISGSGDASVHATGDISVEVSGSGEVDVYGDPSVRRMRISGSGEINRK